MDRQTVSQRRATRPERVFHPIPRIDPLSSRPAELLEPNVAVSVHLARAVCAYMAAYGCPVDDFLAAARVSWPDLNQPSEFMSHRQVDQLVRTARRLTGDSALSLKLGKSLTQRNGLLLHPLLMNCPTLRVAFQYASQFLPLVLSGTTLALREDRDSAHLRLELPFKDPLVLQSALELSLSWILAVGRIFVGHKTAAREVSLPYPAPEHAPWYETLLGCPARFQAEHAEISFDRAFLDLPRPCTNDALLAILREHAEASLTLHEGAQPLYKRVRLLLERDHELLGENTGSLLGQRLGVSLRALRRRLRVEGVSLSDARDQVRKQVAFQLLTRTAMPMKAISEYLGYSECSPFYRAFRRWSGGMTPTDYRRERRFESAQP